MKEHTQANSRDVSAESYQFVKANAEDAMRKIKIQIINYYHNPLKLTCKLLHGFL
jgi:hypothetical protein